LIEDLTKNIPSVYKLVILAARRAQELNGGAPKLVETRKKKMLEIALDEIKGGKIGYEEIDA